MLGIVDSYTLGLCLVNLEILLKSLTRGTMKEIKVYSANMTYTMRQCSCGLWDYKTGFSKGVCRHCQGYNNTARYRCQCGSMYVESQVKELTINNSMKCRICNRSLYSSFKLYLKAL